MYVPLCSADFKCIPAFLLPKVRKGTHLNASKPTSRNGKKSRMLDWLEINEFIGDPVGIRLAPLSGCIDLHVKD
jgi:hypothetical protein